MWIRQYKGSGDPGCDPALQLLSHNGLGKLLCLPPSAFLPVQKGAFTSFEKCYLETCTEQRHITC